MALENQVLALDKHKKCGELNRLMGSIPLLLDEWVFNGNTDINVRCKPAHMSSTQKGPHTITNMNDNIHMDIIIPGILIVN